MDSDQKHNKDIAQLISSLIGIISIYVYYLAYNKNNPYAILVFACIYFVICHPLLTYFLYSRIYGNADTDIDLIDMSIKNITFYVFIFIAVYLILRRTPVVEYFSLLINKIKQYVPLQ